VEEPVKAATVAPQWGYERWLPQWGYEWWLPGRGYDRTLAQRRPWWRQALGF